MRIYQLVLVVKPSLSESERKKLLESVKTWLGDIKITKTEEWGQKVLAYPLKKEEAGYFVSLALEGENGISAEFAKKVLQQENILRHLTIRTK